MLKFEAALPTPGLVRSPLSRILITAATLAMVMAPPALAATVTSSNWAGYAVHRAGVRFTKVFAVWRQPGASCPSGRHSYSAVWVGLGGYSTSSNALEQIGTEVDCKASGKAVSSAWFELIPAASRPIRMPVRPGDSISASVTVVGQLVTLTLGDATRHRTFQKTVRTSSIDVSSAEWIVEAPSECISATSCHTLPLANFRSATFGLATAQSTTGHVGTLTDGSWDWTRIRLTPHGRRFITNNGSRRTAGAATPGELSANGSAFTVTFFKVPVQGNPFYARRAGIRAD